MSITLRARQQDCHDKIIESYKKGHKEFLLAAACRFGKTLTTLQTLYDMAPTDQAIVIISTMDVKKEWKDNAKMVGYDTALLEQAVNDIPFDMLAEDGRHVIYCSTQKLGNGSDASQKLIKWFNRHKGLKTLVYDECHLGSGTPRTITEIIERLQFDNKIYLSGTPYRKHLKSEFGLDLVEGEEKSFLYTIMDEREDFKNGIITEYTPVQLEMHVLDYAKDIDTLVNEEDPTAKKYGVSSAYFKKIFSEPEYHDYAIEFLDKILSFAQEKDIKSFLFFVPLRRVGNDIVKHFQKKYANKIEFRNLCGEYITDDRTESDDEQAAETEAAKLSAFYQEPSQKLKIGITCNKCGTGTTLKGLDAVAFLKDTTQAIPFIQKSQRVRTPEPGKTVGYCLCFNQWQGLKAFCDYSRTASKNENDSEKTAVQNALQNGAIKLILNMNEVTDYAEIIDILSIYRPGQYPLFEDFDWDQWPEDTFKFMTTLDKLKEQLASKHPELRDDPGFKNANTLDELQKALNNAGVEERLPTEAERRQLLEDNYVAVLRMMFNINITQEQVLDLQNYDGFLWQTITTMFGTKEVWEYIIRQFPRYVSMVYNYLMKQED